MTHQFNPGDLALTIVRDVDLPTGSCVELVRKINKGDRVGKGFFAPTPGWHVKSPSVRGLLAYGDHELMPLRRDFAPAEQKSQAEPV